MIANCHLGFVCANVDESIKFYMKYLGLKKKFSISYQEFLKEVEKNENPEKKFANYHIYKACAEKGLDWLTYLEWPEDPGHFLELFYNEDPDSQSSSQTAPIGYTHFAVIVENLEELRAHIIAEGGEEYLDTDISLGMDFTYQMWMHDPDGNKFEIMQYTDKSYQLIGKIR